MPHINYKDVELKTLPFLEQSMIFATFSSHAYLNREQGTKTFNECGFDATLIDVDGSQAWFLRNDHDLVLVCRGTEPTEFKDIASDLKFKPVTSATGTKYVHRGFKESVDNIWPDLQEIANDYGKTRTIWCTGHSLGAAMATLAAYRLQKAEDLPSPEALFTYGSPKVGTKAYIEKITNTGLQHYRFVNNADIVTRVPMWPYQHFGDMQYMNHYGHLRAMTAWQVTKDRLRGFWVGIKRGEINYFTNHSIERYAKNLTILAAEASVENK